MPLPLLPSLPIIQRRRCHRRRCRLSTPLWHLMSCMSRRRMRRWRRRCVRWRRPTPLSSWPSSPEVPTPTPSAPRVCGDGKDSESPHPAPPLHRAPAPPRWLAAPPPAGCMQACKSRACWGCWRRAGLQSPRFRKPTLRPNTSARVEVAGAAGTVGTATMAEIWAPAALLLQRPLTACCAHVSSD